MHLDQLGLEGAVERLGHRVVVAVSDGADRGGGADLGELAYVLLGIGMAGKMTAMLAGKELAWPMAVLYWAARF
ncbi:hypothetical protein ACFWZR_27035 [Streptomyces sp. NPDC059017]|uniref:hypothetical protein n=1 Tax=unclassified Streptomyces TaxID=2593676 RepID=UPI00368C390D